MNVDELTRTLETLLNLCMPSKKFLKRPPTLLDVLQHAFDAKAKRRICASSSKATSFDSLMSKIMDSTLMQNKLPASSPDTRSTSASSNLSCHRADCCGAMSPASSSREMPSVFLAVVQATSPATLSPRRCPTCWLERLVMRYAQNIRSGKNVANLRQCDLDLCTTHTHSAARRTDLAGLVLQRRSLRRDVGLTRSKVPHVDLWCCVARSWNRGVALATDGLHLETRRFVVSGSTFCFSMSNRATTTNACCKICEEFFFAG